jgi:hypothetical protein
MGLADNNWQYKIVRLWKQIKTQLTNAPHVSMDFTHLSIPAKKSHRDAIAMIKIQATVWDVWFLFF